MRLYRESRVDTVNPWVSQLLAEGADLEGLQREAVAVARREGASGTTWTWTPERLGGLWELKLDDHNCFVIRSQ